jgi:hypothetical protein
VLANGVQQDFGPRDEILRKIVRRPPPPVPAAATANLKIVSDTTGGGQS